MSPSPLASRRSGVSTGVYTVRITETVDDPNASDVGYTLVVGVDGTASLEPNDELNAPTLRNITDTQDAVGYLDAAADAHDIYLLDLTVGETVTLSTKSPADPQVSPVNTLDPASEATKSLDSSAETMISTSG